MSDQNTLADLHEASGKVREMYGFGDQMLMVASDRISAFDVVLPTPIPDKGRVLTGMSLFWFDRFKGIVPNHLISAERKDFPIQAQDDPDLAGRSMLVRRLTMMPIECVVRGYLVGSGWKDYQATGSVCGHALPAGLRAGPEAAGAALHPGDEGHRRATTSTSTARPGRSWSARSASTSSSGSRSSCTRRRPSTRDARDHHRRHQVRVRHRRPHQRAGARRRGAHARLVAILAGRLLPGRDLAAVVRQAVRARLARDARLEQGSSRPRDPRRRRRRHRRRYVEAYDVLTGGLVCRLPREHGRRTVKVTVTVRPRDGILDPQGETLRRSLAGLGYAASDVRAGKVFDLELDVDDAAEARRLADRDRRSGARQPADRAVRDRGRERGRGVSQTVGIVTFPGACDDRDAAHAVELMGAEPVAALARRRRPQGRRRRAGAGRILVRRPPAPRRDRRALGDHVGRRAPCCRRRQGARRLQRLPGADRGRTPAGSAATKRHLAVSLPRCPAAGRARLGLAARHRHRRGADDPDQAPRRLLLRLA